MSVPISAASSNANVLASLNLPIYREVKDYYDRVVAGDKYNYLVLKFSCDEYVTITNDTNCIEASYSMHDPYGMFDEMAEQMPAEEFNARFVHKVSTLDDVLAFINSMVSSPSTCKIDFIAFDPYILPDYEEEEPIRYW